MGVNYDGISVISSYAQNAKRFTTIDVLHERILRIIQFMDRTFFARSLKMLLMEMSNLMLLDIKAEQKAPELLSLLDERYKALRLECEDNTLFDTYFKKYKPMLHNIAAKQSLPFTSDDSFRYDILHQYPVIFCSSANTTNFYDGIPGEKIFSGELHFSQIKMIFTPFEFVNDLLTKIANLHLPASIQVLGYVPTNVKQVDIELSEYHENSVSF